MPTKTRKSTKLWTMKDGTKIRMCDMDDSHLINTIKMLQRYAKHKEEQYIKAGYMMLAGLQGEMAIDTVERDLDGLQENGLDPSEVCPIYADLTMEATRRGIEYEDI